MEQKNTNVGHLVGGEYSQWLAVLFLVGSVLNFTIKSNNKTAYAYAGCSERGSQKT